MAAKLICKLEKQQALVLFSHFDLDVHIADEVLRSLIVCVDGSERDHYMFLHSALAKCERCLACGFMAASWRRSQRAR